MLERDESCERCRKDCKRLLVRNDGSLCPRYSLVSRFSGSDVARVDDSDNDGLVGNSEGRSIRGNLWPE